MIRFTSRKSAIATRKAAYPIRKTDIAMGKQACPIRKKFRFGTRKFQFGKKNRESESTTIHPIGKDKKTTRQAPYSIRREYIGDSVKHIRKMCPIRKFEESGAGSGIAFSLGYGNVTASPRLVVGALAQQPIAPHFCFLCFALQPTTITTAMYYYCLLWGERVNECCAIARYRRGKSTHVLNVVCPGHLVLTIKPAGGGGGGGGLRRIPELSWGGGRMSTHPQNE